VPFFIISPLRTSAVSDYSPSIIPTLSGFIRVVGGTKFSIPIGASCVYSVVWPIGAVVAATVYVVLNLLFPYGFVQRVVCRAFGH
jgi:cytosine/uracil/thiamine/allantoin permease